MVGRLCVCQLLLSHVAMLCFQMYGRPTMCLPTVAKSCCFVVVSDVWSAGCVLAELLLGQPVFPGDSGVDQLVEIIKVLGTPTKEQIREMNPNYQEFKFPQIKPHPWQKVSHYFGVGLWSALHRYTVIV